MSMFHRDAPTGDIHKIHQWSYGDAAAKSAATGFASSDVGKVALQVDTKAYYLLTNHSPITWQLLGDASAATLSAHTGASSGAHAASAISNTPSGNLAATDVQAALNELQTDVDTRATSTALTSHTSNTSNPHSVTATQVGLGNVTNNAQLKIASNLSDLANAATARSNLGLGTIATLAAPAGTVVGTGDTQVLTNKDLDGGTASNTSRITLPKGTLSALQALTRKEGTILYATDQAKAYIDNGSSLTAVGSGSGAGLINYLLANPDAETDTTGWTTYADAAATPVDLTGGSPTGTWARSTSNPLRGTASFLYTAGALGNGVAYTITPDRADIKRGAVQTISLEFEPTGTIAEGDYQLWVYDVANSVLIQPTGYKIPGAVSGTAYKHTGTFQLPTNGTTFRVGIHQAVASPGGALKVDSVSVGPQSTTTGAFTGEWKNDRSLTPSAGFGTITNSSIWNKQVTDSLKMRGTLKMGTLSAVDAYFTLPAGLTIDAAKAASTANVQPLGYVWRMLSASTNLPSVGTYLPLFYDGTNTDRLYISSNTASFAFTKQTANNVFSTNDVVGFYLEVPISGWGSSMVLSSSSDEGRPVAARVYRTTTQSLGTSGTAAKVQYDGLNADTHAAFDRTTNYRHDVKVSGWYDMLAQTSFASNSTGVRTTIIYKGSGTALASKVEPASSGGSHRLQVSNREYLEVGEFVYVEASQTSGGALNINSGREETFFTIALRAGSQTIGASETMAVAYGSSSGQSIASGAPRVIDFATKLDASHDGLVTTGSGWRFIPGSSGRFRVTVHLNFAGIVHAVGDAYRLYIRKNGATEKYAARWLAQTTTSISPDLSGSGRLRLLATDYIDIAVESDKTNTLSADVTLCYVEIERIGNY